MTPLCWLLVGAPWQLKSVWSLPSLSLGGGAPPGRAFVFGFGPSPSIYLPPPPPLDPMRESHRGQKEKEERRRKKEHEKNLQEREDERRVLEELLFFSFLNLL